MLGGVQRARRAFAAALSGALGLACASYQPINQPIESTVPSAGYRPAQAADGSHESGLFLFLAFSGGGMRAGALAYGVLEELRDTRVEIDGRSVRLIDEVDTLSGVSGGSVAAAYFALHGEATFDGFEPRYLRRNVQRALLFETLRPRNWLPLLIGRSRTSDVIARYYDREVFDHATFGDLHERGGPRLYVNAADLSRGYRFTFSQGQFDAICSDLEPLPVATAVAASSAVPVLFSPVTLRNYAGRCGYELPGPVSEAYAAGPADPRRYSAAASFAGYLDSEERPFIHLIDGGTADNLGLRGALELLFAAGSAEALSGLFGLGPRNHIAVIVVNAEPEAGSSIDRSAKQPSIGQSIALSNAVTMRRYTGETMALAREAVAYMARELSTEAHPVTGHVIEVGFAGLTDAEERRFLAEIPTNLDLSDEQVDRAVGAARELLRSSPEFQELLRVLQADADASDARTR